MSETITRGMLERSGPNESPWIARVHELSRIAYPGEPNKQALCAAAIDSIMHRTVEGLPATEKLLTVDPQLENDQVEDWVLGRGVEHVETVYGFHHLADEMWAAAGSIA